MWNWRSLIPSQSTFGSLLKLVYAKLWSSGPFRRPLVLREILHSAISALLLSLNQSSRLALLSDRGRTLSRPWWRLREMYICRYWLISAVNIMQGSVVLMLRTETEGKCCRSAIIYNDRLHGLEFIQVQLISFWNVHSDLASQETTDSTWEKPVVKTYC